MSMVRSNNHPEKGALGGHIEAPYFAILRSLTSNRGDLLPSRKRSSSHRELMILSDWVFHPSSITFEREQKVWALGPFFKHSLLVFERDPAIVWERGSFCP